MLCGSARAHYVWLPLSHAAPAVAPRRGLKGVRRRLICRRTAWYVQRFALAISSFRLLFV